MPENSQARLHAVVEGLVQGVGFRAFVQQQALMLGFVGWVRNRWDGSVEVLIEGEKDRLDTFLAALRRGPRAAHVSAVQFEWQPFEGEFKSFSVRSTST